jgi:hypothetical protein
VDMEASCLLWPQAPGSQPFAGHGPQPLIELSLFRRLLFSAALATSALFFAVTTGLSLVVVVHRQFGAGNDALTAALTLLPWTIGMGAASLLAGARLVTHYGDRLMYLGLTVLLAGVFGAIVAYHATPSGPQLLLLTALAAVGVGLFPRVLHLRAARGQPAGGRLRGRPAQRCPATRRHSGRRRPGRRLPAHNSPADRLLGRRPTAGNRRKHRNHDAWANQLARRLGREFSAAAADDACSS